MIKSELQIKIDLIDRFLQTLASINTYVDSAKDYHISLLEKGSMDINQCVQNSLLDDKYTISTQDMDSSWRTTVKEEARLYFFDIFSDFSEQLKNSYRFKQLRSNLDSLLDEFIEMIDDLQLNVIPKKVFVEPAKGWWYEALYDDYVFDVGTHLVYVHFGLSD